VKFLVDAQLPCRFCNWLRKNGHDALHTLDLELGNRTTDSKIARIADCDVAHIYGVEIRDINKPVANNTDKIPQDISLNSQS